MKRLILVAALMTGATGIAKAQWVMKTSGGAFDDNPLHLALTANSNYGFSLRCNSETSEALYLTSEKSPDEITLKFFNDTAPKLRLRPDKGAVVELDAKVVELNDKVAIIADIEPAVYKAIRDAKSSLSVVMTVLSKNLHENTFNVRGAKAIVSKLIAACKIDQ